MGPRAVRMTQAGSATPLAESYSRPSLLLAGSTVIDVPIACVLAIAGIVMAPLSVSAVAATLAAAGVLVVALDLVKWPVFMRLGIA
jgi:hypothetical protein